jgi:hypothetical protein
MAIETIGVRAVLLGLEAYQRGASSMSAATNQMGRSVIGLGVGVQAVGTSINAFGRSVSNIGSALTLGLTTPLIVAGGLAVRAATTFDDAFFGVAKTVDGVADIITDELGESQVVITEFGQELSNQFRQLALEIPISAAELARIGEIAGQLGVPKEEILDFTQVIAELGVSTTLSSEQAC